MEKSVNIMRTKIFFPSNQMLDDYQAEFKAFIPAHLSENISQSMNPHESLIPYFCQVGTSLGVCKKLGGTIRESSTYKLLTSILAGEFQTVGSSIGLRPAFSIVYDAQSDVVKSCKDVTQSAKTYLFWHRPEDEPYGNGYYVKERSTSTMPIVTFDNKECIWLNKRDCERGRSDRMDLMLLKVLKVCKNLPQFLNDQTKENDLLILKMLYKQSEQLFSKRALSQMVEMEMIEIDPQFRLAFKTFIYTPEQKAVIKRQTKSNNGVSK